MDETGKFLLRNDSEFEKSDLSLSSSIKNRTPGIKEALVSFEVVLDQSIPLTYYDNNDTEADLVILRAVASSVDESVYNAEKEYIMGKELNPVSRLGGVEYGLTEVLDFERKF